MIRVAQIVVACVLGLSPNLTTASPSPGAVKARADVLMARCFEAAHGAFYDVEGHADTDMGLVDTDTGFRISIRENYCRVLAMQNMVDAATFSIVKDDATRLADTAMTLVPDAQIERFEIDDPDTIILRVGKPDTGPEFYFHRHGNAWVELVWHTDPKTIELLDMRTFDAVAVSDECILSMTTNRVPAGSGIGPSGEALWTSEDGLWSVMYSHPFNPGCLVGATEQHSNLAQAMGGLRGEIAERIRSRQFLPPETILEGHPASYQSHLKRDIRNQRLIAGVCLENGQSARIGVEREREFTVSFSRSLIAACEERKAG